MATDQEKATDALGKLLQGVTSAMFLLHKAMENRFALECLVLQSNIIDGSLRVGLILKSQLDLRTQVIDETLLRQNETGPKISETDIYQRCRDAKIIDQALFIKLSQAYKKVNQCIHGYVLTDVNYDDASRLVFKIDELMDSVKSAIGRLEKQQVKKGVGMTKLGPKLGPKATEEFLKAFAGGKEKPHGRKH